MHGQKCCVFYHQSSLHIHQSLLFFLIKYQPDIKHFSDIGQPVLRVRFRLYPENWGDYIYSLSPSDTLQAVALHISGQIRVRKIR